MIFEQLFILSAIVGSIMLAMHVVGANMYDVRATKQRRQILAHPYARKNRERPLITVVLVVRNDAARLTDCLNSLISSAYKKLEIIIIDCASEDATKAIVKDYIAEHPKRMIKLVAKRSSSQTVLSTAADCRKQTNGKLIMVGDVSHRYDKQALANAVAHFNADDQLSSVSVNRRILSAYSAVGLFEKYENFLMTRSKKFESISNSDYATTSESVIYKRTAFMDVLRLTQRHYPESALTAMSTDIYGRKRQRCHYASDVVVYSPAASSFRKLIGKRYRIQSDRLQALWTKRRLFFTRRPEHTKFLGWVRLPFAVCVGITALVLPVLLSYFIYVAFRLHEPTLLIISWIVLILFVLFAVWGDEQLKLGQKMAYSLFIPMTYLLFYVLSFVQIVVVLKGLMTHSQKPTTVSATVV